MNKYVRCIVCIPCGILKMAWLKLFHAGSFNGPVLCLVSPHTEITIDKGAKMRIGNSFKMRDGAKIRVRKGGKCIIGNNTSINSNNIITCHESIEIGDNCQFSPNVHVYDHDHDFRGTGGLKAMKFKTAPIKIGDNVWIGANTVILRGTEIGNNCVIGAGSVVKGKYEDGSVIVQKRTVDVRKIE
ncbi:MAG: acyltransferase [Clostridia bacterium]|nr:acyltransferase [Clostridia bacterium]